MRCRASVAVRFCSATEFTRSRQDRPRYHGHVKRLVLLMLLLTLPAIAARRILYFSRTDGFRHDSIETAGEVLSDIGRRTGAFEVVRTEDISQITAANLRNFDAVFFFTSGELPFTDQQKRDLLDFVRQGKGFGGAH